MKAVVYDAPLTFGIVDLPTPQPSRGEVRVRVELAGVCGTDRHIHDGDFFAAFPLVPGHEPVGIIDEIGEGCDGLTIGQRVAVNGVGGCGLCRSCQRGHTLYCKNLTALGVTGPGAFAEYMIAPQQWCFPVGDMAADVAVFAEPTACAMHGISVAAPSPGSDALILGAGPTGLILAQLVMHGGAARVTVAAPSAPKLELARSYGIDETFVLPRADSALALNDLRDNAPDGYDLVVDATGAASVTESCIGLTADGGTVLIYGVCSPDSRISISPYDIYRREIVVRGSFAQSNSFLPAIAALRSGRVRTDGLITHRYSLSHYGDALAALTEDQAAHKIVVAPAL